MRKSVKFRIIPGFSKYKITPLGKVINIETDIPVQSRVGKNGYVLICITDSNGVPKTVGLHRLLGLSFIKNPKNKPEINHKDCNKTNNSINNLEWCTRQENAEHYAKFNRKRKIKMVNIIVYSPPPSTSKKRRAKRTRTEFNEITTVDEKTGCVTWDLGMSDKEALFVAAGCGHKQPQPEKYLAVKKAIKRGTTRSICEADRRLRADAGGRVCRADFGRISALLTRWKEENEPSCL